MEEVYAELRESTASSVTGRELVFTEMKLGNEFSKARRIKNLEICELLEDSGFESVELLSITDKVKVGELKEVGEEHDNL